MKRRMTFLAASVLALGGCTAEARHQPAVVPTEMPAVPPEVQAEPQPRHGPAVTGTTIMPDGSIAGYATIG